MSSNTMNEDLRSVKTKRALYEAMFSLLKSISFKKITIKEICEEALISRATFYAHFIDKYDLLKHWIPKILPNDIYNDNSYENLEKAINNYVYENKTIFKNLIYEADEETFEILFDFLSSILNLIYEKKENKELYTKNIVLSNFYVGGMISYLKWQVKNRFPPDVPLINKCFYEIIRDLDNRR